MVLVTKKAKTPPLHHRKRQADHHKRTKPYEKAYWPYLPMLAIAGISLAINFAWIGMASHPMGSAGSVLGISTGITQDQLLTETNQDRYTQHAGSLTIDSKLTQAAQAKAQDMAAKNYWSHVSPGGTSPWSFINQTGYKYLAAGENLAYGFTDSSAVVNGWMHSPEHKANLLNSSYQNVGFGIVRAPSYQGAKQQTIVVALYGEPTSAVGIAPSTVGNDLPAQPVARLATFAGNTMPGAVSLLILVTVVAASIVVLRHLRFVHRAFAYGEAFVVHHPMLDVVLVGIVSTGVLLSRTVGFIH